MTAPIDVYTKLEMQKINLTVKGISAVLLSKLKLSRQQQFQRTQVLDVYNGIAIGPTFGEVYIFIYKLFRKAQIEPECLIAALIYIEKFQQLTEVQLTPSNFIKLVFTAIMVASKTWDDVSCSSKSFSMCSSHFTLSDLAQMEQIFCSILDYRLFLEGQDYKDYYYNLKKVWLSLVVDEKSLEILGWNEWNGEMNTSAYYLNSWGIQNLLQGVTGDIRQIKVID